MTIETVTMEPIHTNNFNSRTDGVWRRHILSPNALPHLQDVFNHAHDFLDARSIDEVAAICEVVDKFLEEPNLEVANFAAWLENIDSENGVILSKFHRHELYAALCLMYVRDALAMQRVPRSRKQLLSYLRHTIDPDTLPDTCLAQALADTIKSFSAEVLPKIVAVHEPYRRQVYASRTYLAGECAMRAMESVKIAERIVAEASTQASEQIRRKTASQVANDARHACAREAKELVCRDWERERSRWISVSKAAKHYVPWLLEHGYEFKPRTIAKWIRSYARAESIELRPW